MTRRPTIYSLAMLTLFGLAAGLTGCGGGEGGATPDSATQQKPEVNTKGETTYDLSKEAPTK